MILFYFLLHILIQPVYADEATPSATPLITVSSTPEVSPPTAGTPVISLTPTPEVTVAPTEALIATASPKPTTQQDITTPAPTHTPVFSANQITSPTPPLKKPQLIAHATAHKTIPLVNQFASFMSIPKDFLSYSKQGDYYPSTKLPEKETKRLLEIALFLFVAGLLLISWDSLVLSVSRIFKRNTLAYTASNFTQENEQKM